MGKADDKELAIQTTTMAIRETLMEYFKGGCVERVTINSKVKLNAIRANDIRFRYQRREYENQQPKQLFLNATPLAVVQKAPDQIEFNRRVFDRSPELRAVHKELLRFTKQYLPMVEVKHNHEEVFHA
jgi:hypothetical protein